MGTRLELGRRCKDLVGVDEQPAWREARVDAAEQSLLVAIRQMVDRESGDDEIVGAAETCRGIVGHQEDGAVLLAQSLTRLVEHRRSDVDQRKEAIRMAGPDHGGEQAGAGAKVEAAGSGCWTPLRHKLQGGSVECSEAGDQATPSGVVLTGDGVEGSGDRHGPPSRTRGLSP